MNTGHHFHLGDEVEYEAKVKDHPATGERYMSVAITESGTDLNLYMEPGQAVRLARRILMAAGPTRLGTDDPV